MNSYLLSIIIPTKNRQEYVSKAIKQILSIRSDKIQLVIQDNSDDDTLRNVIIAYGNDKRLKYRYTDKILSFVDNFSEAVSLSDGEYICIIGDDDGIMPDILPLAEWLYNNDVDVAAPVIKALYVWPSAEEIIHNARNGYLCISHVNDGVSLCDTKRAVKELMSYGGQKYLIADVAKLYHGIVRKRCMDKIKNSTGHYFGGLSPDIYAAVALSLVADKVVKLHYPVTVSGICKKSGSADSVTGKHTGKLEDAPHFTGHKSYNWSDEVPAFYSVETIWADTALQALRELNADEYIKLFNIPVICMYSLKNYPEFKNIIAEHCRKYRVSKLNIFCLYVQFFIRDFLRRCIKRLLRKRHEVMKEHGIRDMETAVRKVVEQLRRTHITIGDILHNLDEII